MISALIGWLALLPVAVATTVLVVELASGILPVRRRTRPPWAAGSIAVVIPARDEARTIAATLAPLIAAGDRLRLLVIADNCSDATADIARAAGAEVAERSDPARRGKGYALAHARDRLAADPPDTVIVVDADCTIDIDAITALCAEAQARGRPVQAAYLMRPRRDLGMIVAVSGFAFLVKNLLRQRGLARLGAPAILTGSGMAFPWAVFAAAPLATAEAVEDLLLGITLSSAGCAPLFRDDIIVWTDAAQRGATRDQRGRWERGFLATGWTQAPSLLRSLRPGLTWLGLHLLVPPLALLVLLHILLLAAMLLLPVPVPMLALELGLAAAMILMLAIAWAAYGRPWLRWWAVIVVPLYMAWKLPIYAAALLRRERRWNRTRR